MMDTIFRRAAADRSRTAAAQVSVSLRYAARAGSPATLGCFLASDHASANHDDPFIDAVLTIFGDPGLTLDPPYRRYYAGCRDNLTPRQAAERWCCWRAA